MSVVWWGWMLEACSPRICIYYILIHIFGNFCQKYSDCPKAFKELSKKLPIKNLLETKIQFVSLKIPDKIVSIFGAVKHWLLVIIIQFLFICLGSFLLSPICGLHVMSDGSSVKRNGGHTKKTKNDSLQDTRLLFKINDDF